MAHQVVSESGRVDDGEKRIGHVAEKVALVLAGLLGDRALAVVEAVHLEAAAVETSAVVVLISAHQDIGQAGLADTGGTLRGKNTRSDGHTIREGCYKGFLK